MLKLNNIKLHALYWTYSYGSDVLSSYLFWPNEPIYPLFLFVNTFLYMYYVYVIYFILKSIFLLNVLKSKIFLISIPIHIYFCFYLATILNNYAHLIDNDIPRLNYYVPLVDYIFVYSEQFIDLLILVLILFTYEIINLTNDRLLMSMKEKNVRDNLRRFQKLNNSGLIHSLHECVVLSKNSSSEIQKLVEKFYSLICYYISYKGVNTMTTVNAEIDNINSYFVLLNGRFSNKYSYEIKVNGSGQNFQIPYMALMVFVENACKYGNFSHSPLLIDIEVINDVKLKVNFQNEIDYSARKGEGLGITNFLKRLNILCQDKYYYKSYTAKGWYFTELMLPNIV